MSRDAIMSDLEIERSKFVRLCNYAGLPSNAEARYSRDDFVALKHIYETITFFSTTTDEELSPLQILIRDNKFKKILKGWI